MINSTATINKDMAKSFYVRKVSYFQATCDSLIAVHYLFGFIEISVDN